MLSHTRDMAGHRMSLRGALSPLKADPGLGHCLQGGGIPRQLPGNSCLSPTSDTSVMHLLHQLTACPVRAGGLLLPHREQAQGRAARLAPCRQQLPEMPIQTQRCHSCRNGHTDTPAEA